MVIGLHVKCRLFLSDFNETWIFWTDFSKNYQISNFMKLRPVGAALFHADRRAGGQRNTTKLKVASHCLQMSLTVSGCTLVELLIPLCVVALRRILYLGGGGAIFSGTSQNS